MYLAGGAGLPRQRAEHLVQVAMFDEHAAQLAAAVAQRTLQDELDRQMVALIAAALSAATSRNSFFASPRRAARTSSASPPVRDDPHAAQGAHRLAVEPALRRALPAQCVRLVPPFVGVGVVVVEAPPAVAPVTRNVGSTPRKG